jgi:hypothetical protein
MNKKIFIKQDGVESTVDIDQLKVLLRDGCVKPQAQMRNEGETMWKSAEPFLKSFGFHIGTRVVAGALVATLLGSEETQAAVSNVGESVIDTIAVDTDGDGVIDSVFGFLGELFS